MNQHQFLIDLNKVSFATLYWRNREDNIRVAKKPIRPSVHGIIIEEPDYYAYPHKDYPLETNIERARRLEILDEWTPVLKLTRYSSAVVTLEGSRAVSLWKAWNAHIFDKKHKIG